MKLSLSMAKHIVLGKADDAHVIYSYVVSDIKDHSMRKETCCLFMDSSCWLAAKNYLCALSNIQDSTYHTLCYTICGALAGKIT